MVRDVHAGVTRERQPASTVLTAATSKPGQHGEGSAALQAARSEITSIAMILGGFLPVAEEDGAGMAGLYPPIEP